MKIKFSQKKQRRKQHRAHVQQLREHCHRAWQYIKNQSSQPSFGFSNRPWILLFGTPQSGKTSILQTVSPILRASDQSSLVNWQANDYAIFIDPASNIALPADPIKTAQWETLLKMIRRYRKRRPPLHHAILVIDLPSVFTLKKETMEQLSKQLQSIQSLTNIIPVSLVISKCDHIEGFHETFDDLNAEERKQIFGMEFSNKDREKNELSSAFERDFTNLINRIRTRRLERLYHEQNIKKRQRIFAFPTKFAALAECLEPLITHLPFNNTIPLHGIYFTATTEGHPACFTDAMVRSILTVSKQHRAIHSLHTTQRLFALPVAALIILGCSLLWHTSYRQTIQIIKDVQTSFMSASTSTSSTLPKDMPWLFALNTLHQALETIQGKATTHYQWLGLPQTKQLKITIENKYRILLQTQFLPYLKSTLLTEIQLATPKNKLALFDALKAYISASNKKYYNKNIIMNWYRTYWKAVYKTNIKRQANLQQHLFNLLESNQPLWPTNLILVQSTQAELKKLSLLDLAFLELQGEYDTNNVPIFSNGRLDGISLNNATVPTLFSTAHFKDIFNHKIPHIDKILAKGNWVLGTKKGKVISAKQQAEITKKIQLLYLQYYTNAWASTITAIQLQPANDYAGILQQIHNLLNEHSDLTKLLNVVVGNASLRGIVKNKNLIAVKNFVNKKGSYQTIQKALTALKHEIQTLKKSSHPDKASYLKAVERFKNNNNNNGVDDPISLVFKVANQNPEPIHSWLNTIALSSWTVILKHSKTYLNQVWQTIVLPVYHNEIENRYPVFNDSRENISLKNFNDFFGPNGTIGAYFIYYLQPFVNMKQNYWTWKKQNGVGLDISQNVLNTFIRASIIQQMFFTDHHNTPSFRFTLTPLTVSNNIKKFTLNMSGQIYNVYQKTNHHTKPFSWPGSDPTITSIQFITSESNDKPLTTTYDGPWSWFRMLDAHSLQTTANPKQFTLTLQSGKNTIRFKLTATHRVNPMIPGVISKYRCPENLT